ncbi:hypothetical protein AXX17_AT1G22230 [Arabidopsis thaliana]|uniref:Uncharacterized protein n=1 Tax=Arabidopsis thaliana TaxID=3702 RepID=A0A178WDH6_ARATH|nr:hypothetical protein AXX17_AT1G22230 [Arabidopsis thaliana]
MLCCFNTQKCTRRRTLYTEYVIPIHADSISSHEQLQCWRRVTIALVNNLHLFVANQPQIQLSWISLTLPR